MSGLMFERGRKHMAGGWLEYENLMQFLSAVWGRSGAFFFQ